MRPLPRIFHIHIVVCRGSPDIQLHRAVQKCQSRVLKLRKQPGAPVVGISEILPPEEDRILCLLHADGQLGSFPFAAGCGTLPGHVFPRCLPFTAGRSAGRKTLSRPQQLYCGLVSVIRRVQRNLLKTKFIPPRNQRALLPQAVM